MDIWKIFHLNEILETKISLIYLLCISVFTAPRAGVYEFSAGTYYVAAYSNNIVTEKKYNFGLGFTPQW